MRTNYVSVLLLTAIAGFTACKKIENRPLVDRLRENDAGTLTVKLNGKDWNDGIVHAYYSYYYNGYYNPNSYGRFDIALESFDGNVSTSTLRLSSIDQNRADNPIIISPYYSQYPDSTTAMYYTSGSDYIGEQFTVKTTGGYVAIDNYENGYVKGHFEVTLVREFNGGNTNLPDTLRFTEGKFDLRIY